MEGPAANTELARWLQEERAGVSLTETEIHALVELHGEALWRQDICVRGNITYTPEAVLDLRAMIEIVAQAAVEKLVEAGNLVDKAPHKLITIKKYVFWWMQPSRVWGFMPSQEAEPAYVPAPLMASRSFATAERSSERPPVLSETEPPLSKTAIEDMRVQGVTSVEQLCMISVSMQCAQKVGAAECQGTVHGGSVTTAAIIKRMNKSSKGARTLDDVLRDAMVTGDLSEVIRHVRKTVDRFSADRSDRVFCDAGGQFGRLWSRALALNEDGGENRIAVRYMQLWNDEYSCRGIPEIDNWSLVHEAERYPYDKHPLKANPRGGKVRCAHRCGERNGQTAEETG